MATMPVQKPGRSKQDYQTPKEFVDAVKRRLHIKEFSIDLAASPENTQAFLFYDEKQNALLESWNVIPGQWAWLNPPYDDLEKWTKKAVAESQQGAHIAMLVPASVGANWWKDWVEYYAYQVYLNGRLCFIPDWKEQMEFGNRVYTSKPLYPKDCALLLYTPWGMTGHEIWTWEGVK